MGYPFFPNRGYESFTSLVLRNSGQDWMATMIGDAVMTGLMDGSGIDVQAYRPVATYINGRYWGMYNLREKVNEDYLANRHGVDPDAVDILEKDGEVIEGSNESWLELMAYVTDTDMTTDANYARVADEIDIGNYLTYQAAQIYYDNRDWPGNNIKFWRAQTPGAKWRWILFDTDFGAGLRKTPVELNTLAYALVDDGPLWPNPPWSTLLFRKLIRNDGFRHQFVNRLADLMNSRLRPDVVATFIATTSERVATEVPRAFERWGWTNRWERDVGRMSNFFAERPAYVRRHVLDQFDLPGHHQLTVVVQDTTRGHVSVNTLDRLAVESAASAYIWRGQYFEDIPIIITAVPAPGFKFARWESDVELPGDATIKVNLSEALKLQPIFRASVFDNTASLSTVTDLAITPNPARDNVWLSFRATEPVNVSAKLFSADGKLVMTLVEQRMDVGEHTYLRSIQTLLPGSYFVVVRENGDQAHATTIIKR